MTSAVTRAPYLTLYQRNVTRHPLSPAFVAALVHAYWLKGNTKTPVGSPGDQLTTDSRDTRLIVRSWPLWTGRIATRTSAVYEATEIRIVNELIRPPGYYFIISERPRLAESSSAPSDICRIPIPPSPVSDGSLLFLPSVRHPDTALRPCQTERARQAPPSHISRIGSPATAPIHRIGLPCQTQSGRGAKLLTLARTGGGWCNPPPPEVFRG